MRQQEIQRFNFAFWRPDREHVHSAVNQVIEIPGRTLKRFAVSLDTVAPDKQVRIKAGLQAQYPDIEFFFNQSRQRAISGSSLRCVSRLSPEKLPPHAELRR